MASGAHRLPVVPGIEVQDVVGRGGFATVYRAWQPGLDRTVALKVIHPGLHADPDMVRRFERECRAIGSLTGYPTVMTVFDVGTTSDGDPYMVLEFLPSGSLSQRLAAEGALDWRTVAAVGVSVSMALDAAHSVGIIHRDVKPANVLQDRFGGFKLGDFGIAGMGSAHTTTLATTAATVAFAAPEVLMGNRATVASDLYGLGATLYALITGSPAFWVKTEESVVPMIMRVTGSDLPPVPESLGPPELRTLIEELMAKAPDGRPPDAPFALARFQSIIAAASPPGATPTRSPLPTPPEPAGPPAGLRGGGSGTIDGPALAAETRPPGCSTSGAGRDEIARRAVGDRAVGDLDTPTRPVQPDVVAPFVPAPSPPALSPVASDTPIRPPTDVEAVRDSRTRRRMMAIATAVVVVVVLSLAAGVVAMSGRGEGRDGQADVAAPTAIRSVPPVAGKSEKQAIAALRAAGFDAEVTSRRTDEKVAKGMVANQVPDAGSELRKGAKVDLAVSLGPAPRVVPKLVGAQTADALRSIQKAGLVLGNAKAETSGQPSGTVIRTHPAAGANRPKGSKVDLVISSGPGPAVNQASAATPTTRPRESQPSTPGTTRVPTPQQPAPRPTSTSPPTAVPTTSGPVYSCIDGRPYEGPPGHRVQLPGFC